MGLRCFLFGPTKKCFPQNGEKSRGEKSSIWAEYSAHMHGAHGHYSLILTSFFFWGCCINILAFLSFFFFFLWDGRLLAICFLRLLLLLLLFYFFIFLSFLVLLIMVLKNEPADPTKNRVPIWSDKNAQNRSKTEKN